MILAADTMAWLADCRTLVTKYRASEGHADKVARLSDQLFTLLAELHRLEETDRPPLVAAGFLHDIGRIVDEQSHHKQSHYLILNDGALDGWEAEFRQAVAVLSLNHRKRKRLGMADLERKTRRRLRALAAILRIADVLDRQHTGSVEILKVTYEAGATSVQIELANADLAFLEPHLARKAGWAAELWQVEIAFVCGEARVLVSASDAG